MEEASWPLAGQASLLGKEQRDAQRQGRDVGTPVVVDGTALGGRTGESGGTAVAEEVVGRVVVTERGEGGVQLLALV